MFLFLLLSNSSGTTPDPGPDTRDPRSCDGPDTPPLYSLTYHLRNEYTEEDTLLTKIRVKYLGL